MASKRNIKKDINYLTGEVIADCFLFMHIHEGKSEEKTVEIVNAVVKLRNDLMQKVNQVPAELKGKQVKVHFKSIYNELLAGMDEQLQRLSKLASA
jgi:hypothetical protein